MTRGDQGAFARRGGEEKNNPGWQPYIGRYLGEGHISLTVGTAGSGNNRADRRDDGLRQDRHSNRNRGQTRPLLCREHQVDILQSKVKAAQAVDVVPARVATRLEVVEATRGGTRALTVTTVATTPVSGQCFCASIAHCCCTDYL